MKFVVVKHSIYQLFFWMYLYFLNLNLHVFIFFELLSSSCNYCIKLGLSYVILLYRFYIYMINFFRKDLTQTMSNTYYIDVG